MHYWNDSKDDTKAIYQEELCRKTKLEADLLQAKVLLNNKTLVNPELAIEQLQRDFSGIKDKLITMKMLLLNECEGKTLKQLDKIFTDHITKTLEGLCSMSRYERLLKED